MSAPAAKPAPRAYFHRFDRTERAVHWTTAALMLTCVATALPLYVPAISTFVGRRHLILDIHVYAGLCLPIPLLVGVSRSRWGAALRADLSRLNRWTAGDRRWVRTWGRDPLLLPGKFNGGQKANAAFVGGATIVMMMTGSIMKWFGPFPLSWRTGATFVHDVVAYAIVIVVLGHVGYALRYPATLRAMTTGVVREEWAREHAPGWAAEIDPDAVDAGEIGPDAVGPGDPIDITCPPVGTDGS